MQLNKLSVYKYYSLTRSHDLGLHREKEIPGPYPDELYITGPFSKWLGTLTIDKLSQETQAT